jgi:ribosomal protein S18 acetylase RimI-like enzyme
MSGTNTWIIRDGRPGEAAALLELWRIAKATPGVTDTLADVERMLAIATVLVAQADGSLIGSVFGVFDGWRANLYRLAVHPSYRRRGVARALVAEVEGRLLQQGAKRLSAIVEGDHPWATAFWQAAGYATDPRIRRYTRTVPSEARPSH